jgi:hypothetical protein
MKSVLLKYSICIALALFLFNCKKKKKEEKVGNDPPTIELVSVTPGTAKEFKDSIIIVINYKDVNGDLGDDNPDELSLQVKDSRLQNYDAYHIKPLAPDIGKDISIEGNLKIKLNSLFLLGGGTTELATLTIKLKDRAGNWSNEVSSQPIIITK